MDDFFNKDTSGLNNDISALLQAHFEMKGSGTFSTEGIIRTNPNTLSYTKEIVDRVTHERYVVTISKEVNYEAD